MKGPTQGWQKVTPYITSIYPSDIYPMPSRGTPLVPPKGTSLAQSLLQQSYNKICPCSSSPAVHTAYTARVTLLLKDPEMVAMFSPGWRQ